MNRFIITPAGTQISIHDTETSESTLINLIEAKSLRDQLEEGIDFVQLMIERREEAEVKEG